MVKISFSQPILGRSELPENRTIGWEAHSSWGYSEEETESTELPENRPVGWEVHSSWGYSEEETESSELPENRTIGWEALRSWGYSEEETESTELPENRPVDWEVHSSWGYSEEETESTELPENRPVGWEVHSSWGYSEEETESTELPENRPIGWEVHSSWGYSEEETESTELPENRPVGWEVHSSWGYSEEETESTELPENRPVGWEVHSSWGYSEEETESTVLPENRPVGWEVHSSWGYSEEETESTELPENRPVGWEVHSSWGYSEEENESNDDEEENESNHDDEQNDSNDKEQENENNDEDQYLSGREEGNEGNNEELNEEENTSKNREENENNGEESETNNKEPNEEDYESNNEGGLEEENETEDEDELLGSFQNLGKWGLREREQYRKRNPEDMQEEVIAKKPKVSMRETPNALGSSQTTIKIHDIQCSLQSAFKALEYYKERDEKFDHVEAECIRVKAERDQLGEKNNKIADDLQKTKHEVQSYKQKSEQKSIQMDLLQTRFAALEQDLKHAKEDNCQIYKEKEKLTEDLEHTRLQVEYYRRIDNLKGALKSVTEFPGLRQVLHQKNISDPESSKVQTGVGPEVSTKKRYVLKVHEIDDSLNCPICFEPWSESADHSICSIACGHFFGRSCITRWINKTGTGSSNCPQCLRSATLKDIRKHYVPETFVGHEKI